MMPPKPKTKPEPEEGEHKHIIGHPSDPLAAQVKAHALSIESILDLLRYLGPSLPALLLADPAGVDARLSKLKDPGGRREGELLHEDK